jgi:hypothetical protein
MKKINLSHCSAYMSFIMNAPTNLCDADSPIFNVTPSGNSFIITHDENNGITTIMDGVIHTWLKTFF